MTQPRQKTRMGANKTNFMANINKYTFEVRIKVKVETELPIEDAIDDFGSNCDYSLPSTDDCKVISTEIIEVHNDN